MQLEFLPSGTRYDYDSDMRNLCSLEGQGCTPKPCTLAIGALWRIVACGLQRSAHVCDHCCVREAVKGTMEAAGRQLCAVWGSLQCTCSFAMMGVRCKLVVFMSKAAHPSCSALRRPFASDNRMAKWQCWKQRCTPWLQHYSDLRRKCGGSER